MRPELAVVKRVHMVGIGGSGMSGIAEILWNIGFKVTGSDIQESNNVKWLRSLGIPISIGHSRENLRDAQLVIISSAIKEDNVEVQEARARKIPVIARADALAQIMRMKYSIAVAGTHGKTTTTSMIGIILKEAGLDPTIIVGGIPLQLGSTAKLGKGEFLVAEADESDGSFLKLYPFAEVITNIEEDHLDHYSGIDDIVNAFHSFILNVPFFGFVVINRDDPRLRSFEDKLERFYVTYSIKEPSRFQATPLGREGNFWKFRVDERIYRMSVPGIHNIYNATAAIALCRTLGIDEDIIAEALARFSGVKRRLEFKGEIKGVAFFEDYAHHPTEIRAVISTLREVYPSRRILVVFQPHRYSRLAKMREKFAIVLAEADAVIITEVYPAGEKPIEGVDGESLYGILKSIKEESYFCPELENLPERVRDIAEEGDIVAILGAGNVNKYIEKMKGALNEK